jgi:acyl carrier protein
MAGRTGNTMDAMVELRERILTSILDTARSVSGQELVADADPVAAGFDSIESLQLAAVLEEELGVDCTLEDVFDAPSFAALADVLVQRIDSAIR